MRQEDPSNSKSVRGNEQTQGRECLETCQNMLEHSGAGSWVSRETSQETGLAPKSKSLCPHISFHRRYHRVPPASLPGLGMPTERLLHSLTQAELFLPWVKMNAPLPERRSKYVLRPGSQSSQERIPCGGGPTCDRHILPPAGVNEDGAAGRCICLEEVGLEAGVGSRAEGRGGGCWVSEELRRRGRRCCEREASEAGSCLQTPL